MYGIEILVDEHDKILLFIDKMEKICVEILQGEDVPVSIFRQGILFIRNFADRHHHKKEEEILFKYMIENLGGLANKLVKNGMLVEHDLARLHVMQLEKALNEYERTNSVKSKLDIIGNMMSYIYILRRHIEKENTVVYIFAENNLSKKIKEEINIKTRLIEEKAKNEELLKPYKKFLTRLAN
ncbi:hemerythrin domain-containing protein [Clostridium niameyense]|uniref:hemerythrin domain-containing protein n=1 Tax=Clostridium niameyense TaxID=1622073 RepID=UPI00067F4319|nr:hemerythrin domain-containing protein [Clostridium niameyense]